MAQPDENNFMWIFWAFQMTPEQVRTQFVFIKLAHIDEGYFCSNKKAWLPDM